MEKKKEKNNFYNLIKNIFSWPLRTTCGQIISFITLLFLILSFFAGQEQISIAQGQFEAQKVQAALVFKVEINEIPSSDIWIDEKTIWNNRFSRIVSIKNISDDQVILSNEKQKSGYSIFSHINVFYESNDWLVRNLLKKYDFPNPLEPTGYSDIDIDIELPIYDSWNIVIEVWCLEIPVQKCRTVHDKKIYSYRKKQVSDLKIIFVDATKIDDTIKVQPFRKDLKEALWVSGDTLKAVASKNPFPLKHSKTSESWGGAILLYNPLQGHSSSSDITLKIKELLLTRFWYIGDVVIAEYNLWNFKQYGSYLSECKPINCISKSLKHQDLNLETNLFSKELFNENPKEDFMIFLPYSN